MRDNYKYVWKKILNNCCAFMTDGKIAMQVKMIFPKFFIFPKDGAGVAYSNIYGAYSKVSRTLTDL